MQRFLSGIRLAGLVSIALGVTSPVAAQEPAPVATLPHSLAEPLPECGRAALDATFPFGITAEGEQTVWLHFRNVGATPCRIEGQGAPSFSVDGHSMNVASCWRCDADDQPLRELTRSPGVWDGRSAWTGSGLPGRGVGAAAADGRA